MIHQFAGVCLLGLMPLFGLSQDSYFLLDPTLSPDAQIVVFSYDGDLWKVPATGGNALRLTAMEGDETLPRISPDGKWLAFSATQYGNNDVYVMPLDGGAIRQLTFHDAADEMVSWSWDSQAVYFTSNRDNRFTTFKVAISGGTPERLFGNYFNTVHNLVEDPVSGAYYFNESWESKYFVNRKRYKGDYNPDIKSYDPATQTYTEHTSYRGKDLWPAFDRQGTLYFASDEGTDEYNLFSLANGTKKALTNFDTSIGWPQVSANGAAIVFTKDYQLFRYDTANGTSAKVLVSIARNNTLEKAQDFEVQGKITAFDISPDNKKLAFISRGRLFVSDVKGKFIRELPTAPNERVVEVHWLKDNRTLLFNRTVKGYLNWFTIDADGKGPEKQHTDEARNNKDLSFNPDRDTAAYISGRDELRLLDLKTFNSSLLVKDEFWALNSHHLDFSADGRYLAYEAFRNFETDIFAIRLADKKITNLTQTGVSEGDPHWSEDGRYLYFSTNFTQPDYPRGQEDTHIYRMALDKYEAPYRQTEYEQLFKAGKEDDAADKKGKKKAETAPEKKPAQVHINELGLMDRLERISPEFGRQGGISLITKDSLTRVFYLSNHDQGDYKLWQTTIQPFEDNKTEKVTDEKITDYQLASAEGTHYLLYGGDLYTLDVDKNSTEKIKMDFTFRKNLSEEFTQMFYEAWANFEENYYDGDFHGQDWQALRDKYAAFLPYLSKRTQLTLLFNDMLGELNTSHFGFYSNGKEDDPYYGTRTNGTGLVFSKSDPYTLERVIAKGPADVAGKDLKKGDVLTAVNDRPVDTLKNRESYFAAPSRDKELKLTFNRNGQSHTVLLHPDGTNELRGKEYDEWVAANQAYVDSVSDKKIAYVHMKDMGDEELEHFKREMVSEANSRQALILDLRYNTGGNVHDEVLQFLSQKPYLQWKYRDGKPAPQPTFAPSAKPMVLLVNAQSLSDAEMTATGFKALKLGTIVGTETYRWIIFTSGRGLVDGSYYRLPSWGCFTLDGKDIEKNGVSPDIYVKENFKDRLTGRQPQLDKAMEVIGKELDSGQ